MNGIFAIKKPIGPSSQECVGKLKHVFTNSPYYTPDKAKKRKHQFIKIGHGGTLDPLADGVLVIGVGSGTKQLQKYLGNCEKSYTATCLFGCSTTTYDSEGSILGWSHVDIENDEIEKALTKFQGKISQVPPVFSALKMDGMPLYEYARKGIPLPRKIEARECDITHITASPLYSDHNYNFPESTASDSEKQFAQSVTGDDLSGGKPLEKGLCIDLSFSVSSGTYIRSLIHDLARELGVQAHMVKLTRNSQSDWELGKNVLPLDIFDLDHEKWWPLLKSVLDNGPKRNVEDDSSELLREKTKTNEPEEPIKVDGSS